MEPIRWNDAWRCGVELIDEQHIRFIALIESLRVAVDEGRGDEDCLAVLIELWDYVNLHFASEEALQQQIAFPGLAEHRQQHGEFAERVRSLVHRYRQGEKVLSQEVLRFLADWMINHIGTSDAQIGRYVSEHRETSGGESGIPTSRIT